VCVSALSVISAFPVLTCLQGHERVVLIVDLWHPGLTLEERSVLNRLFANSLT
jgi:hypothetical protein